MRQMYTADNGKKYAHCAKCGKWWTTQMEFGPKQCPGYRCQSKEWMGGKKEIQDWIDSYADTFVKERVRHVMQGLRSSYGKQINNYPEEMIMDKLKLSFIKNLQRRVKEAQNAGERFGKDEVGFIENGGGVQVIIERGNQRVESQECDNRCD